MERTLNCQALTAVCNSKGISPAHLARTLEVSREAVSKWFNGEAMPRPDKLLKMGQFLKVKYSDIVIERKDEHSPVVAYRKKAHRKTQPKHIQEAEDMGLLLEQLVPYLSFNQYQSLPTLENPVNNYVYLQKVCGALRQELDISASETLDCFQLIDKFTQLNAVIIPVFWGEKDNHGQGLRVYLPDSKTTWIYLNLDARIHDFKFWMAHELGHVYAPLLQDDDGEDFADAFAQALLFPECLAKQTYQELSRIRVVSQRIVRINEIAEQVVISPYTIIKAVAAYSSHHSVKSLALGNYGAVTNFNKTSPSVGDEVFSHEKPDARTYIDKTKEIFKTPFFDALKKYLNANGPRDSFVQQVMQIPLIDAKALTREL